ncbi:hypothetical protein ZWY2020_057586 [Hordeum vulgare]|nr:hypothetical protein ZWY2020_057586 [Hordeum vulgare]
MLAPGLRRELGVGGEAAAMVLGTGEGDGHVRLGVAIPTMVVRGGGDAWMKRSEAVKLPCFGKLRQLGVVWASSPHGLVTTSPLLLPLHPRADQHRVQGPGRGGGGASRVLTTALIPVTLLLVMLLLYLCVTIAVSRIRGKREGGRASQQQASQSSCAVAFFRHPPPQSPSPSATGARPLHTLQRSSAVLCRHDLHHGRPTFTYEQLRAATAGFDTARKLRDGGFDPGPRPPPRLLHRPAGAMGCRRPRD